MQLNYLTQNRCKITTDANSTNNVHVNQEPNQYIYNDITLYYNLILIVCVSRTSCFNECQTFILQISICQNQIRSNQFPMFTI